MLEAIALCEELTGRPMNWTYVDDNRIGDHIWWISDVRKFAAALSRLANHLRYPHDTDGNIRSDAHAGP